MNAKQWVLLLLCPAFFACHTHHDHDHNDHSQETDHGHAENAVVYTQFNENFELFAEHEPFVVGTPTTLITHLTILDGWQPRTDGPVRVVLLKDGVEENTQTLDAPARDGIYEPVLTFPSSGDWQIDLHIPTAAGTSSFALNATVYEPGQEPHDDHGHDHDTDTHGHSDGDVHDHGDGDHEHGDDHTHADGDAHDHDDDHAHGDDPAHDDGDGHGHEEEGHGHAETTDFLKEQQWRTPFAVEPVRRRTLRASLSLNGTITARAGGEVVITAPNSGLLQAEGTLPHIGMTVKKGQRLGVLVPQLQPTQDAAALMLELQRAELDTTYAQKEHKRLSDLYQQKAVPWNRVLQAQQVLETAEVEHKAAKERLQQFNASRGATEGAGSRLDLIAPFTATVIEANFVPGSLAEQGQQLFHLADLERVWLTAQVPESDLALVQEPDGAWFQLDGDPRIYRVDTDRDDRLVALGGAIHPQRRTVPLVFDVANQDGTLRIGMFAKVAVYTGAATTGPAIPASAVLTDGGLSVVFVQTGGESFERRMVRTGIREGDWVHIASGLKTGERVVTTGAFTIKLAGATSDVPDHGHAH